MHRTVYFTKQDYEWVEEWASLVPKGTFSGIIKNCIDFTRRTQTKNEKQKAK